MGFRLGTSYLAFPEPQKPMLLLLLLLFSVWEHAFISFASTKLQIFVGHFIIAVSCRWLILLPGATQNGSLSFEAGIKQKTQGLVCPLQKYFLGHFDREPILGSQPAIQELRRSFAGSSLKLITLWLCYNICQLNYHGYK